ncbi:MAG: hypothetical protein M1133_12835 [Armatimonadetes bacterium]|nr:hypothetical protein [Armatimonadota bacterium]
MESGNLSNAPDKLDIIASIMSELHYDAVGLGMYDLQLGDTYYQKIDKKLKVLDAAPGAAKSSMPYMIRNVDGVRVGIISFGGVRPGLDDFAVRRSFYGAYKAARDGSDILILLDQANWTNKDWLERNLNRLGAPDVVIGGAAKMGMLQDEVIGKTHIVPTSYQGKCIGVCDVEVTPGQEPKIATRKITLDTSIVEDPILVDRIRRVLYPNQARVASMPVASQGAQKVIQPVAPGQYYPSIVCRTCHSTQYDDWAKTKHAKAIKTLADEGKMVSECLTCHSEKYRRSGSLLIDTSGPGGVDCATCHMNAIPHGAERKNVTGRTKVAPMVCLECHTKDRSPNYNPQTYFPMVTHPTSAVSNVRPPESQ